MIKRFKDLSSGADIATNLFYGFVDSGSLAGSFTGYPTREDAIASIKTLYEIEDENYFGTKPEDLSMYAVTVLSGQEFVDELTKRGILDECGYWLEI